MTLLIYVVTSFIVAVMPLSNGYTLISITLVLLTLFSPMRTIFIQLAIAFTWIIASNFIVTFNKQLNMPQEYYLYILYACIFLVTTPFYISHAKRWEMSGKYIRLTLIHYSLFLFGFVFLCTACLRSYPISYFFWGTLCLLYCYYTPGAKIALRPVSILGYGVLFTFLTITTLLLFEIGVRLFFIAPAPPGGYYMPHKEAIFTFRPNSSGTFPLKDNDENIINCTITISSQNVRDKEYSKKDTNTFRIVLLGDSYTMGHGLKPKNTIDKVLENLLQENNNNYNFEIINCGVGAYAPWQERIFLNEYGFQFNPDMVILQLHPPNDVAGSYSKVGKYLDAIDVQWENTLLYYRRQNELRYHIERKSQQLSSAYRLLLAASKSSGYFVKLTKTCRLFPIGHYPTIIPKSDRFCNAEVCLEHWYPELEEAWDIYADSIKGIREDCQKRGVDLIAFSHGSPNSLQPQFWKDINIQHKDTPYEENKDIRLTNELLAKLNIPFVDVFSTLEKYPCDDIYYIYDGHFTPKGAAVVASCLRDFLIENNCIQ